MTNGLLVLMISGHGGQIADWNKDEVDGFDETWCLFDKMVTDDNIFAMLSLLRSDIRIVLINDQCHSEANFKNFVKGSDVYIPRIFKKIGIRGDADISLIQFASCRESEFSYGGMTGGSFINSLILNYKDGITWGEWFNIAKTNIVSKQTPVLIRYGKRADEIVNSLIK
jgi:hypothetical protein